MLLDELLSQGGLSNLTGMKEAHFRGMAVEYGLTYEEAKPFFDRYEESCKVHFSQYQQKASSAFADLQAALTGLKDNTGSS